MRLNEAFSLTEVQSRVKKSFDEYNAYKVFNHANQSSNGAVPTEA